MLQSWSNNTFQRFAREIKIWDRARHKNCLSLQGYTLVANEAPALVTEWMENGTIVEYIKANPETDLIAMVGT